MLGFGPGPELNNSGCLLLDAQRLLLQTTVGFCQHNRLSGVALLEFS